MKILSTLLLGAVLATLTVAATPKPKAHPAGTSRLVVIRMDIDFKPHKRSSFGRISGYDPAEVHVHMGDRIQFVNPDDQTHTATGMAYTGDQVPANYKFQSDFTKPHGRLIDASEWGTGNVRAHGGKSPILTTKRTGHYFYACGYHIGIGQIGVIVVEP